MSRIGKKPIDIPDKTEISISGGNVTVKGPGGTLAREFKTGKISVVSRDKQVVLTPNSDSIETRALWGTYASHIKNMIKGVNTPYEKKLILEGVGYRAEVKGKDLVMGLGFSHQVKVPIPDTLKISVEKNIISISGIDKEEVGSWSARVRAKKKPEPYKGKGIHYSDEVVRRKEGKKTA
ncbi:MAG: 50S ribosomal protein L6 [bacterium]|nr:50S ribosomal protein L6 [bacterium]